ncbi:ribonuclease catalytic domain-containing protein [Aphanothece sacrum]|uniref:Ribonuclease II n=1 Tax=Aphanothece sacrum FPU1 TaxID=1920663 RepID=A0A401IMG6_APHSA|nr:ribonuclease R family protein [Aphanothece sacrum]GBF82436.1 ribonuclease II [Aphanothece sacrum FPU1]GBF84409.1 ribonuclease II [Aphanothece sacrum FPU3]
MEKGKLIEIRLQGERRLAVLDRPEGKKDWIVIDEAGHPHKIRPQRIEYEIEGGPYEKSDIPQFLKQVQAYLDPSSLEVAWELLVEDGEAVTPSELAQLLFSEKSPVLCYAAHSLLCEDKIYFKNKGNKYEPRSANQVEEIKHQLDVEQQRQEEKEVFFRHIQQAIAKEKIQWTDNDRNRLESLERFVLQPEQTHRNAQDILSEIGRATTPEAAFNLLLELGWWSPHENLFLRRSSYPINFSKKVLDVAHSYLHTPPPDADSDRLDLTHFKVYTIDDESTEEIDDGLSVEFLEGDQIKLWIHIADPTRLVSPGDELDLEARRRSTTLYLPTGMISMFPLELATGPMSLRQGKICPALSFGVRLDDKGAVLDYSIHASLIKPTYRLTYHDVDEMLQLGITAEPEIDLLAKASQQRHLWRQSQGSITIKMPEAVIKVKSEDDIVIELVDNSRSRQLVAEMMILAGEVAGRYCQEHSLPVPFRGQPQPELPSDEELLALPPGPVRACALRRCMPRSEIGTLPSRHASLGLNTYTQVTSPIRRYTDLLTHFQLKAHLRGDPLPFALDVMQQIVYSVTLSAQEATFVERQTNRYWGLEFLRRNGDQIWQGVVLRWLREDEKLGVLLLEELGLELPHRFERSVSLGDRLNVQVSRADPHRDEIRFREMLEHESSLI